MCRSTAYLPSLVAEPPAHILGSLVPPLESTARAPCIQHIYSIESIGTLSSFSTYSTSTATPTTLTTPVPLRLLLWLIWLLRLLPSSTPAPLTCR